MGFHELCAIGRSMSRVLPASLGLLCVSDGLSVWTRRGAIVVSLRLFLQRPTGTGPPTY